MRVRNILSIAAFIVAFTASAAIASVFAPARSVNFVQPSSTDRSTARNIYRFLERDIQNGEDRDHSVYRQGEGRSSLASPNILIRAQAVADYSETSGAMNYDNLPQDFQLAWLKHMRAWHNYSDFLQKAKLDRMSCAEIRQLENQYDNEISRTWFDVLRIAQRYGSDIPPGAY